MKGKVAERMCQGLEGLNIPIAHEKLIKQADLALYQAKSNGRNRVEMFDEKMNI